MKQRKTKPPKLKPKTKTKNQKPKTKNQKPKTKNQTENKNQNQNKLKQKQKVAEYWRDQMLALWNELWSGQIELLQAYHCTKELWKNKARKKRKAVIL